MSLGLGRVRGVVRGFPLLAALLLAGAFAPSGSVETTVELTYERKDDTLVLVSKVVKEKSANKYDTTTFKYDNGSEQLQGLVSVVTEKTPEKLTTTTEVYAHKDGILEIVSRTSQIRALNETKSVYEAVKDGVLQTTKILKTSLTGTPEMTVSTSTTQQLVAGSLQVVSMVKSTSAGNAKTTETWSLVDGVMKLVRMTDARRDASGVETSVDRKYTHKDGTQVLVSKSVTMKTSGRTESSTFKYEDGVARLESKVFVITEKTPEKTTTTTETHAWKDDVFELVSRSIRIQSLYETTSVSESVKDGVLQTTKISTKSLSSTPEKTVSTTTTQQRIDDSLQVSSILKTTTEGDTTTSESWSRVKGKLTLKETTTTKKGDDGVESVVRRLIDGQMIVVKKKISKTSVTRNP
jgi:hypothetical protein